MSVEWIKAMLNDDAEVDDLGSLHKVGEWINDAKWQHKTDIVNIVDNKEQFTDLAFEPGYYCIEQARSGSYWSDYEYDEPTVTKVEPYEETITVTKWRNV